MNDQLQLPSDQALVEQTRAGSEEAWTELRSRHVDAVRALARSRTHRRSKGSVDAVFDRLRQDIATNGPQPDDDRSAPVRPRAIGLLTGGAYGPVWNPPTIDGEREDEPATASPADGSDLVDLATAFGGLPTVWQAVLWHRWVERAPAAELTAILGRRAADVVALEQTARRGLADGYAEVVLSATPGPEPLCTPVIPLLGAQRRGTLPGAQHRVVDDHVASCDACRRRLDLLDRLDELVPIAIVPGLIGVDVDRYRGLIGAGAVVMGASALSRRRSEQGRRLARVGAVAAVVIALLAVAFFVREPFGVLDSELADLLERASSTTEPATSTTVPGATETLPDTLPNRIELVFPGSPQGAVYVPGGRAFDLGLSLSSPAPFYAGATGTVDLAITNNDSQDASIRFLVRSSPGVSFDRLSQGVGSCVAEQDDGARCMVSLPAGTTGQMSLRFSLDAEVPDRVVVVPSIRSEILELPVELVPGLLVGQVGRGDLVTVGATLGACEESATCPNGERNASSGVIELDSDAVVERAILVWEGDRSDAPWADVVGLIPAGSSTAVTVSAGNLPAPSGTLSTGSGVGASETGTASGFRSVADVTDLVRSAGGGGYTVVRAPSTDELGDGSWTLTVVTEQADAPRRLFVVVRPDQVVEPDAPLQVAVPIAGSEPPETSQRPVTLVVQAATRGSGAATLTVNGADTVGLEDGTVAYDLQIASTEETLALDASTSADTLQVVSIGLAGDIVP
jgi:hypothetical protein